MTLLTSVAGTLRVPSNVGPHPFGKTLEQCNKVQTKESRHTECAYYFGWLLRQLTAFAYSLAIFTPTVPMP